MLRNNSSKYIQKTVCGYVAAASEERPLGESTHVQLGNAFSPLSHGVNWNEIALACGGERRVLFFVSLVAARDPVILSYCTLACLVLCQAAHTYTRGPPVRPLTVCPFGVAQNLRCHELGGQVFVDSIHADQWRIVYSDHVSYFPECTQFAVQQGYPVPFVTLFL